MISFPGKAQGVKFSGSVAPAAEAPAKAVCIALNFNLLCCFICLLFLLCVVELHGLFI